MHRQSRSQQGCNIFSTEICTDKQDKDQGCNIITTAICTDKQGTRDVTYYQQIYAQTIKVGQGCNILFTTTPNYHVALNYISYSYIAKLNYNKLKFLYNLIYIVTERAQRKKVHHRT